VNASKSVAEALRNLGSATNVDDIKAFVAVLIQTDTVRHQRGAIAARVRGHDADQAPAAGPKNAQQQIRHQDVPTAVFLSSRAIFIVVIRLAIISNYPLLLPARSQQIGRYSMGFDAYCCSLWSL